MNRIIGIATGIGTAIFGLVIYPYYIDYFIEPMQTILDDLFPGMNAWGSAFIDSLPLVVLLIIVFCTVMHFLGKAGHSEGGEQ